MPTRRKGESKSDFISRCVRYLITKEGLPQKVALARCYAMAESKPKRSRKRAPNR